MPDNNYTKNIWNEYYAQRELYKTWYQVDDYGLPLVIMACEAPIVRSALIVPEWMNNQQNTRKETL